MQLYSLVDPKGIEARALFNYELGSWVNTDIKAAERVQGWALGYGLVLNIEQANGRCALHCPSAGAFWHPDGQQMNYYLEHLQLLKKASPIVADLKRTTRELDAASIKLLLDQVELFLQDYGREMFREERGLLKAIPIAREALERLVKP